MEETLLASERRLDPMEKMFGVSSESISLKKLSNSSCQLQINLGKSSIE